MSTRPNIVVICTDQLSGRIMHQPPFAELETPALDRILNSGVSFTNTYCTKPLCTPSRASLITGAMPHQIGVQRLGDGIESPENRPHLGHLLAKHGYEPAYAGKWHIGGSVPLTTGHGFKNLCGEQDDEAVTEASVEFILDNQSQPFLLFTSFFNPHDICQWARGENLPQGNIDKVPLQACPSLPQNFAIPPFEPEIIRQVNESDDWNGTLGAMVEADPTDWRRYRHAYFRLIERIDNLVGRLLDALDQRNLLQNTVIIFTSDHGDGMGSHQLNQKWWLYEEIINVPFIIRYDPETNHEVQINDDLVSNGLDLLPTICDYGGIELPNQLEGFSLRDHAANRFKGSWREQVVTEIFTPVEGRMLRTDRYKYIVYETGARREQLFDMDRDIGELVDLSVNSRYEDILYQHRRRLREWNEDQRDLFDSFVTELTPRNG